MQEPLKQKTTFGTLFTRGWKLYGRTLGASFTGTFLFSTLPSLVLTVLFYYAAVIILKPIFVQFQALLQTILQNGFDENAIGRAMEGFSSIGGMSEQQVLGAFGVFLGTFLIGIPVSLIGQIVLQPLGLASVAEAQSRGWHGVKLSFQKAFAGTKGRRGKIIVLYLVYMLASIAASFALSAVTMLLELLMTVLPLAAVVSVPLMVVLSMGIAAVLIGCFFLMFLIGINEDKWHFDALFEAVKRLFTTPNYILGLSIYYAIYMACGILALVMDLVLMLLMLFPPVLTLLLSAFAYPLLTAYTTSVYYDQRKKEGYPPECAL